ncbi:hypothetical protein AX15_004693 [Amanita polypyramis BW_CC]|nr:hypothetical protein AX15_004693 [Amanita polypyramis BW_CC]
MTSINLFTLSTLPAQHKAALERGGIHTVAGLLFTSPQDAARKCRISPIEFKAIVDIVCKECNSFQLRCLSDIKSEGDELFSTGDSTVDFALGGGIRTGMIWEIVGESASGKTQLALQLSLFVQIAPDIGGLEGSCCYLTTSSKLPTQRLLQISTSHKLLSSAGCSLSDVHTIATPSIPVLLHVLSRTLVDFIQQIQKAGAKPVKLVVIDALAELFHDTERTTTATLVERSQKVSEVGSMLHTLAAEHRIAIVVLNEVVDAFDRGSRYSDDSKGLLYNEQSRWFSRGDSVPGEDRKEASLGLAWANQINARIFLTRTGRRRYLAESVNEPMKFQKTEARVEQASSTPGVQDNDQSTLVRRFNVIFSSVSTSVSLDYIVTVNGIMAIPDTVTYPMPDGESIIARCPAPMIEQQGNNTTGHSISTPHLSIVGDGSSEADVEQTMAPNGESEDDWDKYWANDEIPAEVYLSVPEAD